MRSRADLYRFHVANHRLVDRALVRISLDARACMRRSDEDGTQIEVYVCLYALILGAWAETRLLKLLYEEPGFTPQQRTEIIGSGSQNERWSGAVEIAFRTRYRVRRAALTTQVLPHSAFARYEAITQMLRDDLQRVIGLRNKLAHGQWSYPLNEANDDISDQQMRALKLENLLSLQYKRQLIGHLSEIIHDLVVSPVTFDRDFDTHYRAIEDTRRNLATRNYDRYRRKLRLDFKTARSTADITGLQ